MRAPGAVASPEQRQERPATLKSLPKAKCCYNRAGLLTVLIQIPVDAGSGRFVFFFSRTATNNESPPGVLI